MSRFYAGNVLLILCCTFYLLWWIVAFRPEDAVKGMRSGWLLIPAVVFGIAAVAAITGGIYATENALQLMPTMRIVLIGVIAYALLLAGTALLLKRQVTTELFLIVGWAVLASSEISALYAHEAYSAAAAWVFIAFILVMAAVSLVCYLLYYNLDAVTGYIDGMIPLVIVIAVTAVMTITMRL